MEILNITPNSNDCASVSDVVLRETTTTRMIFRGQIVNNKRNPSAPVRGAIVFQKKSMSGDWSDYNELDFRQLKDTEWVKVELKSEEVSKLAKTIERCQRIYEKDGVGWQNREYIIASDGKAEFIAELLQDKEIISSLMEHNSVEMTIAILKWINESGEHQAIINKLQEIDVNKLSNVNSMISIANMKAVLDLWEKSKDNSKEEFWQKLFTKHSWVISQIFATPVTLFESGAYVGGKRIDNKNGKILDFLYKNSLTENVILIEIKTPTMPLMSSEYRNEVYSINTKLTGAVNQVLSYKEELQRNYLGLTGNGPTSFRAFNPKCVIIAGSIDELDEERLESFELFRAELKNVKILTYDEVFARIKFFLAVLETDTC